MSVDGVIGLIGLIVVTLGLGAMLGAVSTVDYWAFRTRRREMEHAERMAIIAQRERYLREAS